MERVIDRLHTQSAPDVKDSEAPAPIEITISDLTIGKTIVDPRPMLAAARAAAARALQEAPAPVALPREENALTTETTATATSDEAPEDGTPPAAVRTGVRVTLRTILALILGATPLRMIGQ